MKYLEFNFQWSSCKVAEVNISGLIPPIQASSIPPCLNVHDYLIIMGGVAFPLSPFETTPFAGTCNIGESCMDRFCDIHFGYANSFVRSKYPVVHRYFEVMLSVN